MAGLPIRFLAPPLVATVLLAFAGCGSSEDPNAPPVPPGADAGPGGPGPGGPGPGGRGGAPSGISKVMSKRSNGVDYLTPLIGKALEADPPAWDTIEPQAKEYAKLAKTLPDSEPPRGSKESWTKLATAFATTAESLDKAVSAKDRNAALDAHARLTESCMECHREHRRMMGPPGGGRMGGPGMKGRMGGPDMKGRMGGPPGDATKGPPSDAPDGPPPPSNQ
jgi:hypothetical protein